MRSKCVHATKVFYFIREYKSSIFWIPTVNRYTLHPVSYLYIHATVAPFVFYCCNTDLRTGLVGIFSLHSKQFLD